jgi:hypothetical protein
MRNPGMDSIKLPNCFGLLKILALHTCWDRGGKVSLVKFIQDLYLAFINILLQLANLFHLWVEAYT